MSWTRSRWLIIAIAALLVTPAGVVLAQGGNETNETDEDEFPSNESANESEEDEANETDEDEEAEASEEDEEDEDDEDEAKAEAAEHENESVEALDSESDWSEDKGTYTGEHLQVTIDEELPGLVDVTYLDPNATAFASVELAGENLTYGAHGHVLSGETDENEFAAVDDRGGHLNLEADDANISIEVADGVQVNESEDYNDDDEDEAVYQLHLANNRTAWFYGEDLGFANGTFTLGDEARLSTSFPPAEEREERDERAEEREERREDRREAGSQWERDNGTFEGDNVVFTLDANDSRVTDYAIKGSTIPVFADADIPADNETEWEAHGKHFELRGDDSRLRIVDVPPAILMVEAAESADAHLVVADGVEVSEVNDTEDDDDDEDAEMDGDDALWRLDLAENRTGWVMGEETTFDNGTFTVSDRAMFRAMPEHDASENRGPGSMPDAADERGPPEDRDEDENESEERGPPDHARAKPLDAESASKIEQAKAAGQVGVEVHMSDNTSEPVAVEMDDVRVQKAWADSEDGVRAGMQIEAPDDQPGTTVTMNLEEGALDNVTLSEIADDLAVSFDNETIEMADDLDDVLDPNDDEGEPEYLLLVGGDEVQVLVSVPHFSPHTIEVYETQSSEQVDSSPVPGFGAASLVLASALATAVAGVRKPR